MTSTTEGPTVGPIPSFPRQQARTRRFSLGVPRNFTVSPDGERVVFLRSPAGDDPATSLWVYDVTTGSELEVAGARQTLRGGHENIPDEERARRERSRELAGGITAYACDDAVRHAAFALSGRLWWVALGTGEGVSAPVELPAPSGVVDPRPDPDGDNVAFLSGPGLYMASTTGDRPYFALAEEEHPDEPGAVTWGAAEFIAAEEMNRPRGFWWSPDGRSLLAARVDNAPVGTWWTADPSQPASSPRPHRYPAAGSADALVTLWHIEVAPGGGRRQVSWDAARFPYLVAVHWSRWGAPLLLVEQRDHKACAVLAVDLNDGDGGTARTSTVLEATDAAWVDWPVGVPAWLEEGSLLWAVPDAGTWRLTVGDELVTPPGLQVREVTSSGRSLLFTASDDPSVVEAWSWSRRRGLEKLTDLGGISSATGDGPVKVVVSRSMSWPGPRTTVEVEGSEPRPLASKGETPVVDPDVTFLKVGRRELRAGVVLPAGHAGGKLPVIMAPYGGPGAQMVMASQALWLEAQWLANQGFAVVVADGRGTPGRGPGFEREVYLDLAMPPLEDQVEALHGAAEAFPDLDVSRVGITGWSFGGYLASLAVLARPDVFHAAVAGAPVTDWRWYDTYYTERFLGRPQDDPAVYERNSLLPLAPELSRPLLLVHGLVDDNVFAVHTLLLSGALLTAGRAHSVLPLPAITHVASREDIAENLLGTQVDFFRRALGEPASNLTSPRTGVQADSSRPPAAKS
jgi:dipeptidyl-peptidase 4